MTDHDQLPEELAGLFEAERSAPAGDPETRAKVRSRLAAAVGLLPAGKVAAATGTATILGGTGKIIAIVAISIGVGVTAVTLARSSETSSATSPAIELVSAEETPLPAPQQVVQSDEGQPPVAAPEVMRVVPETATPPAPAAAPSEAKLLKRAWSALSSGDAGQALELTREAERLHPGGALVEEREALRIQALAKLGLLVDARTAAEQFIVQFPRSVHRTHVENAISSEDSP